ncbi:MAG: T9SS type A sorting domain-containing protein, partial [Candidatus Zixiibacteriota bacterium]
YGSGLQIINVSDPANPDSVGSYDTPGNAYGVFVQDSLAYVADYGSGLQIINVSDPANPDSVGSYDTPANARDVFVRDSLAYVADDWGGLQIINVSSPASPDSIGSYNTPGDAYGLFVQGKYVYVADRYSLIILETPYVTDVREIDEGETSPSDFVLFQNYPNPFNPTTNIEFLLPRSDQVKIEIFNILGQKVRTLVDQHLKAGHKLVDWDGKDDSGEQVSSGIYFYSIKTDEFSQTRKMVLLR